MNRFHVHVSVKELDESIRFYTNLFGVKPSVTKADYAKWMLEDPRINFAISHNRCGNSYGVNHLGLQVDSDAELRALEQRFAEAGLTGVREHGAACCYAQSDKTWLQDPQGIAWENFHTLGSVPVFGGHYAATASAASACMPSSSSCTPAAAVVKPAGGCGPNAGPNCCG